MTMEEMRQQGTLVLQEAEVADADLDAMYLLEHVLGIDRITFLMDRQREVSDEQAEAYMEKIRIRATHVPLQHILGEQEFMGYRFQVNEHVLIPRQDTEILVEEAMKVAEGKRVLDVCTGSGCILLSLSKLCQLQKAVGLDLSPEALAVARKNAEALECEVTFVESDLFAGISRTELFDVIVSNPPYIVRSVIPGLMQEVREHEPYMALDGGEDGLDFYRRICKEAPRYLAPGGFLLFEIGCEQGADVRALMEQEGFSDCEIVKDLAGLDRVVKGHWSVEHG